MYGSACCDREYATQIFGMGQFSSCGACLHDGRLWTELMFVWISTRAADVKLVMNLLFLKKLVNFLD
jgi:hypothetical protein